MCDIEILSHTYIERVFNTQMGVNMTLTQKETTLLQDIKSQEKLCVDKYTKYSANACDGELKNLFSQIGRTEQQHLDTITQILGGTVPSMNSGSGNASASASAGVTLGASNCSCKEEDAASVQNDKYLCEDTLATEKHVSSVYNTSIFEFTETAVRDALNHIQKEEQNHGEQIFDYMSAHGMYPVK